MADLTVAGSNLLVPGIDPTTMRFENDAVVAALANDPRLNKERGSSFGLLDVTTWGVAPGQDNTATFARILDDPQSVGRQWVLPGTDIYPGVIPCRDKSISFYPGNTGYIGQMKGRNALDLSHTLGTAQTVTDVRHAWLDSMDTGSPDTRHAEITLSAASMAAVDGQRGDAVFLHSTTEYFLDPAKDTTDGAGVVTPGAADFNGNGLRTFKGEWVTILGIGVDVTDLAGSGGVRQGMVVTGGDSGATATVSASAVATGGQRVAVLNDIKFGAGGYFRAGENLIVDGTTRGAISTRGPYLLGKKALTFSYSTTGLRVAKGRTDLDVSLDGFRSVAVGDDFQPADVDQFIGAANRNDAIRLEAIVDGKGTPYVKSSWRHGVAANIVYRFTGGITMDEGPAHAEDTEGGWSYAWMNMGACSDNDLVLHGRNVRHVYTTNTNPRPNVPVVTSAGVAHNNWIHDGSGIGCLDAPWDTHGGSVGDVFEGNYAYAGGSGGRTQGRVAAFQMRGFGTIARNNVIRGFTTGVRDVSSYFPAPFDMFPLYEDNDLSDIKGVGFDLVTLSKGSEVNGKTYLTIRGGRYMPAKAGTNEVQGNPNKQGLIDDNLTDVMIDGVLIYLRRDDAGAVQAPGYFGADGSATVRPESVTITDTKVVCMSAGLRGWQIQSTGVIPEFVFMHNKLHGTPPVGGVLNTPQSFLRIASGTAAAPQRIRAAGNRGTFSSTTLSFAIPYTATGAGAVGVVSVSEQKEVGTQATGNYAPMPVVIDAGAPIPDVASQPDGVLVFQKGA